MSYSKEISPFPKGIQHDYRASIVFQTKPVYKLVGGTKTVPLSYSVGVGTPPPVQEIRGCRWEMSFLAEVFGKKEGLYLSQMVSRMGANADYEGMALSLQSPLPNDQDLAISVLSLLSNDSKLIFKLAKCPPIVNLLLAHAGIYSHCKGAIIIS